MVQRTLTRQFGILVLPLAGLMMSACQPPAKTAAVATAGNGIVNGQDAKSGDIAPQGLAESVVILLSTIKSPDRSKDLGTAMCTGTLIDPQVVLTAAHCVSDGILAQDVQVGLHFLNLPDAKTQQVKASAYLAKAFIINPGYQPKTGGQQQNDLALVLLSKPVPTGTRIAQLPAANFDLKSVPALLTIGYGQSDERHSADQAKNGAGVLRYTSFPQGKFELLPTDGTIPDMFKGMIAAQADTTSVCHGDSGGPLMAMSGTASQNVLVGVNDAVLPTYQGQEEADYVAAEKSGDMGPFYTKYPDANICSGGDNLFVNVAAQLDWINATKTSLLAQAATTPVASK